MPTSFTLFSYDRRDRKSVLTYAAYLPGHRLREFMGEVDLEGSFREKGKFGQALERYYFGYPPNNSPEADFKEIGIELKTTLLEKTKSKGWQTRERLILNIIDYTDVEEGCFDRMFLEKDAELLIVFYRNEGAVPDRLIEKVTLWKFDEMELRIMREDWSKFEKMILEGRAHEIREGGTVILTLAPKGSSKNTLRRQPHSDIPAMQRAFALKGSYLKKIYNESLDLNEILERETQRTVPEDKESILTELWENDTTFEQSVIDKTSGFVMRTAEEIESVTGHVNDGAKGYYALLARRMLGVRKKRVAELEDYDIELKILRIKRNGMCKESTSFPAFDYRYVGMLPYEESDFAYRMNRRYLFMVFQMTDSEDRDFKKSVYLGSFFWSLPREDLEEVKFLYEDTQKQIRQGIYDDFLTSRHTRVAHVRPHGQDGNDVSMGMDCEYHLKRCFWLNADYMSGVIEKHLPITKSGRRKDSEKIPKRRDSLY